MDFDSLPQPLAYHGSCCTSCAPKFLHHLGVANLKSGLKISVLMVNVTLMT